MATRHWKCQLLALAVGKWLRREAWVKNSRTKSHTEGKRVLERERERERRECFAYGGHRDTHRHETHTRFFDTVALLPCLISVVRLGCGIHPRNGQCKSNHVNTYFRKQTLGSCDILDEMVDSVSILLIYIQHLSGRRWWNKQQVQVSHISTLPKITQQENLR